MVTLQLKALASGHSIYLTGQRLFWHRIGLSWGIFQWNKKIVRHFLASTWKEVFTYPSVHQSGGHTQVLENLILRETFEQPKHTLYKVDCFWNILQYTFWKIKYKFFFTRMPGFVRNPSVSCTLASLWKAMSVRLSDSLFLLISAPFFLHIRHLSHTHKKRSHFFRIFAMLSFSLANAKGTLKYDPLKITFSLLAFFFFQRNIYSYTICGRY